MRAREDAAGETFAFSNQTEQQMLGLDEAPLHTAALRQAIDQLEEVTGEHVELSTGTGAVHTAPGHGEEDFLVGVKFDLPMPMPVNDNGVFDAGGGPFSGMHVNKANEPIVAEVESRGTVGRAIDVATAAPAARSVSRWSIRSGGPAHGI